MSQFVPDEKWLETVADDLDDILNRFGMKEVNRQLMNCEPEWGKEVTKQVYDFWTQRRLKRFGSAALQIELRKWALREYPSRMFQGVAKRYRYNQRRRA